MYPFSPPPPIITYELGEALIRAAASNSVTKLESLLNQDIDVNFRDTLYGITALHAAVQNRHVQAVKILLEHGARKDVPERRRPNRHINVTGSTKLCK